VGEISLSPSQILVQNKYWQDCKHGWNSLFMDKTTSSLKKLAYARCFIKISIAKPPVKQVKIEVEGGETAHVEVNYDWVPPICLKCRSFGHLDNQCLTREVWREKDSIAGEQEKFDYTKGNKMEVLVDKQMGEVNILQKWKEKEVEYYPGAKSDKILEERSIIHKKTPDLGQATGKVGLMRSRDNESTPRWGVNRCNINLMVKIQKCNN